MTSMEFEDEISDIWRIFFKVGGEKRAKEKN